jgi:hypothetical protein
LLFAYRHLDDVADGAAGPGLEPFINEFTGVYGGFLLFFAVRALHRRIPLRSSTWLARLPLYAAALVAMSLAHTTWNWATRSLLYPIIGLGAYQYGSIPVVHLMEFPVDLLAFSIFIVALHVVDAYEATQAAGRRQLHADDLSGR